MNEYIEIQFLRAGKPFPLKRQLQGGVEFDEPDPLERTIGISFDAASPATRERMNSIRRSLIAALALSPLALRAQQRDYTELPKPLPVENPAKVEVAEFFWYGCPHCYTLEPAIEAWLPKLPSYAYFRRIPAVFNERWALDAGIFYGFETLGVLDKLASRLGPSTGYVLVCDVGGGTTDLSLLEVHAGSGPPRVKRVAVGPHLLLGELGGGRVGAADEAAGDADLDEVGAILGLLAHLAHEAFGAVGDARCLDRHARRQPWTTAVAAGHR